MADRTTRRRLAGGPPASAGAGRCRAVPWDRGLARMVGRRAAVGAIQALQMGAKWHRQHTLNRLDLQDLRHRGFRERSQATERVQAEVEDERVIKGQNTQ